MFEVNVVTNEFKGLSTVKQHRLINEVKTINNKFIQVVVVFCLN